MRLAEASFAVASVALGARLLVVAWAAPRFAPIDDAAFYLRIAERMARGLGYTWVWADGSVTTSAFYPVGYPAMVAAVFAVVGPHPAAAMVLNAVVGALGAFAAHRLALRAARAEGAPSLPRSAQPWARASWSRCTRRSSFTRPSP